MTRLDGRLASLVGRHLVTLAPDVAGELSGAGPLLLAHKATAGTVRALATRDFEVATGHLAADGSDARRSGLNAPLQDCLAQASSPDDIRSMHRGFSAVVRGDNSPEVLEAVRTDPAQAAGARSALDVVNINGLGGLSEAEANGAFADASAARMGEIRAETESTNVAVEQAQAREGMSAQAEATPDIWEQAEAGTSPSTPAPDPITTESAPEPTAAEPPAPDPITEPEPQLAPAAEEPAAAPEPLTAEIAPEPTTAEPPAPDPITEPSSDPAAPAAVESTPAAAPEPLTTEATPEPITAESTAPEPVASETTPEPSTPEVPTPAPEAPAPEAPAPEAPAPEAPEAEPPAPEPPAPEPPAPEPPAPEPAEPEAGGMG